MRIPYVTAIAPAPIPSLAGGLVRYRPIKAVRIGGSGGTWLKDGLLDTGADDTVFDDWVAGIIGLDLSNAPQRPSGIVGRAQPIWCKYALVQMRITDGIAETYEWNAVVGFTTARLRYALLGHAGFLQFFDSDFRGDDHEVILTPNRSFPGHRI